jgi:hypothetical protein
MVQDDMGTRKRGGEPLPGAMLENIKIERKRMFQILIAPSKIVLKCDIYGDT